MVQDGPGGFQPGGVEPGVNHRFASPPVTLVVIPGENRLVLYEDCWVWFAVISDMRTTRGLQPTFGFQEKFELVTVAAAGLTRPGTANRVEMASIAISGARRRILRVNGD